MGVFGKAVPGTGTIDLNVSRTTISGNVTGIGVNSAVAARIGGSTISANGTGVVAVGGAIVASYGTNALAGNVVNGSFTATLPRK